MIELALVAATLPTALYGEVPAEVVCEGQYDGHLQGIAGNGKDTLYWSFTTTLVKTDLDGNILASVEVPYHHGDLCLAGDRLYVAWSDTFNEPGVNSKVYIYDADDLSLIEIKPVPQVTFGAGGMDARKGHFYVIGGLPKGFDENYVYEYDNQFNHVETHTIASGYTNLGIQTACFHDGRWWFGCYQVDGTKGLLVTNEDFTLLGTYDVSPSIGIVGWGEGRFLVARHFGEKWQAKVVPMAPDDEVGLVPAP